MAFNIFKCQVYRPDLRCQADPMSAVVQFEAVGLGSDLLLSIKDCVIVFA